MFSSKIAKTAATGIVVALAQTAAPAGAAALYVIDDFNSAVSTITKTGTVATTATSPQHDPFSATLDNVGSKIVASTPDPYSIGGYSFKRDLSFSVTTDGSTAPTQKATIALVGASGTTPAKLTTTTGTMVATALSLSYDISSMSSLLLGSYGTDATFTVLYSDGTGTTGVSNPTTITAKLDGVNAGSPQALNLAYGPATANGYKTVYFTLPLAMIDGFDHLTFDFTGPTGYDLSIGQIGLSVPEPAMLGLFGLGAIGLGFARRRKR